MNYAFLQTVPAGKDMQPQNVIWLKCAVIEVTFDMKMP